VEGSEHKQHLARTALASSRSSCDNNKDNNATHRCHRGIYAVCYSFSYIVVEQCSRILHATRIVTSAISTWHPRRGRRGQNALRYLREVGARSCMMAFPRHPGVVHGWQIDSGNHLACASLGKYKGSQNKIKLNEATRIHYNNGSLPSLFLTKSNISFV
jgi:hypothetical protein